MSIFNKETTFHIRCNDVKPIADEVMEHFSKKDYEVTGEKKMDGGWHISIHHGGIFKTIVGMKTSLNIEINPLGDIVEAKAGVGIFGQQAIPTAISMLVFWPVLLTQIWGLVQQAKLDDEVMEVIERSLKSHEVDENQIFCVSCGKPIPAQSKFCLECGARVE